MKGEKANIFQNKHLFLKEKYDANIVTFREDEEGGAEVRKVKRRKKRHLGWARSPFLGAAAACDDGEGGGK